MSAKDDAVLNSKIHIATLCKSFGYDGMAYRAWFDHGLVLDADNNISISDFNLWLKNYLTTDETTEQLKNTKLKKEIEQIEIKNAAARGEYYQRSVVDSTIASIFKITKDRTVQLDKTVQRVHTAPDQQQAKLILKDIAREILTDIESGIRVLVQDMQPNVIDQINSTDTNNNTESATDDTTTNTTKSKRGRPRKAG